MDPAKVPEGERVEENAKNVHDWASDALGRTRLMETDKIIAGCKTMPLPYHFLLLTVRTAVEERYSNLGVQSVGSIFFLRWLCPWLSAPEAFGQPPGVYTHFTHRRSKTADLSC